MTGQSPSSIHDPAKRARLIASAAAVFSRVGFDRAIVEEIAQSADVAKGTVYLYFGNKADLFLAVLHDLKRELEYFLDASDLEASSAAAAFVRAHLELADISPDLYRCYTSALFGVNREFQEAALEIFEWQQERLRSIARRLPERGAAAPWSKHHGAIAVACINAAALVRGLTQTRRRDVKAEEQLLLAMLGMEA